MSATAETRPRTECHQTTPTSVAARPQLKLAENLAGKQSAPEAPAKRRRRALRNLLAGTALLAAAGGAGWYGYDWYMTGRFHVSTDDAYIRADISALSAKVAGHVAEVPVAENAFVRAGTVVLTIDPGDYQLAITSAKDRIALQDATIARIGKQTQAQEAAIASSEAKVAMAKAEATNAETNFQRQNALAAKKFASQQALDQALANRDRAQAALTAATADLAAAEAQREVLNAQKREAEAILAQLETDLAKAERDLSFTEIKAPFDGIIGNRAVEPGQYVQPGQRLLALIPTSSAYVEANFKETQLARVKPGQKADVSIDAWGGETIKGTVESIAPASGAEFSLLPPENATGNFTKITQRVPVRIRIARSDAARLQAGLSVVVDVDTRSGGTRSASLE